MAEEAVALERDVAAPVPADEAPEQRDERLAELDERREDLRDRGEDLSNRFGELLAKRDELLDAIQQRERDRLRELAERAAELAAPQDELAEALERERAETGEAVAELARRQEELARRARDLDEEQPIDPAREAVTPLDPELVKRALEELKAGNLAEAARQQDAAADELERLAEALAKNERLSDDPREATEQLAERQRELAERIERENEEAADATDEERAKASRRRAAEQAAIEAAVANLDVPNDDGTSVARRSRRRGRRRRTCSTIGPSPPPRPLARRPSNWTDWRRRSERPRNVEPRPRSNWPRCGNDRPI